MGKGQIPLCHINLQGNLTKMFVKLPCHRGICTYMKMRVICQNIIIHVSLRIVLNNPRNQTLYSFFYFIIPIVRIYIIKIQDVLSPYFFKIPFFPFFIFWYNLSNYQPPKSTGHSNMALK